MKQQPPAGATLEGHSHGDTVTEQTALRLVSRPAFHAHWAILPSVDGLTLRLTWAGSCTLEELRRVNAWLRKQVGGGLRKLLRNAK